MFSLRARSDIRKGKFFTPTVAVYVGQIWAIDFIHDAIEDGKGFRVFNVIDVYSKLLRLNA